MRRNLSRRDATYLGFSLLIFIFIAITFVNLFVYPLRASNPNFSDVERVFSTLEFPADWKEIDSSENSGWYGRVCPIEGSGCFSKGKRFTVPLGTTKDQVKEVFKTSGCPVVGEYELRYEDEKRIATNLECSIDGLVVDGTFSEENDTKTVSIYVST